MKDKEERISHPSHYTWLKEKCGVEVIDITRHLDFDCGNITKYILRSNHITGVIRFAYLKPDLQIY